MLANQSGMKKIVVPAFVLLVLAVAMVGYVYVLPMKQLKADRVWGYGHNSPSSPIILIRQDQYKMQATAQQVRTLDEDLKVNVAYTVVHEENRWIHNHRKALRLIRFSVPFPQYSTAPPANGNYYRLVQETLTPLDHEHAVFTRLYEERVPYHNLFGLYPESIVLPFFPTTATARAWIERHQPEFLKPKPRTIVDPQVLSDWTQSNYQPAHEYWSSSPAGLTVQDLE